jgi:hypothetical protein
MHHNDPLRLQKKSCIQKYFQPDSFKHSDNASLIPRLAAVGRWVLYDNDCLLSTPILLVQYLQRHFNSM